MNQNAFIYLLLTLLKFSYSKLSDQCTKSNTFWYSLKYPYIDVIKLSSVDYSLASCPNSSLQSCCSSEMNKDMTRVSELKLRGFAEDKLESILMMFSNDSYDLMNMYLKDLENTKNDLNHLFSTTYGYNYKVHKDFFFKWFEKLKLYMQGNLNNIGELLDNFFLEMAQRIIRILIAPDSTPEVATCRTTHLIESKPYQDTDVILKKNIIKSYPPARLLVNGIGVGRDVFNELMKNVKPSQTCIEDFNRAFHCMLCQGLTLKSCSKSCSAIIDTCFGSFKAADMKKLDRVFTKYIKVLILLSGKLDNSFNFPEVNNKMNVQISTAIMNVQTMYPTVKDQINAKCQNVPGGGTGGGGLPISRRRRQASQEFYKWQNANSNNNNNNNNNNAQKPWWEENLATNANPEDNTEKKPFRNYQSKQNDALSPFARKLKQKYKALENVFKDRRTDFCSSLTTTDPLADCWNGTAVVKNSVVTTAKGTKKKGEKIEDPAIKTAINKLNEVTKRINSYLSGKNPDPETVPVQEYKLYVSNKVAKVNENNEDKAENEVGAKIDGSGDAETNKFPQPKPLPEVPKKEPKVQPKQPQPDKTSWEFPTWPEGSGDTEKKLPEDRTKTLPIKPEPVTPSSSARSTVSTTKQGAPISSTSSTLQPDDEDMKNKIPPNVPVIIVSSTVASVIRVEGSGSDPVLPDMPVIQSITTTTTQAPDPVIDGSGDEVTPQVPTEKPRPRFPNLPDTSSNAPPIPKPDPNPDEEKTPVEGSGAGGGGGGNDPKPPPFEPEEKPPVTPPAPVTAEPTKAPTEPLNPDQYPGKVPPEVWLPSIKGAGREDPASQQTTPGGRAATRDLSVVVYRTMLIVCWLYSLL